MSGRIPRSFDGFRILQVSDLHNDEFGEENAKLIELLSQTNPDIIVLIGDLIDSWHINIESAMEFAGKQLRISRMCMMDT